MLSRLYEYHPNNTESLLLETMQLVKDAGDQWSEVFLPEVINYVSSASFFEVVASRIFQRPLYKLLP